MEPFLDILEQALQYLLSALLPILVVFVIKWVKAKTDAALAELEENSPSIHWLLTEAADMAVKAAEQLGLSGVIEDKREYAFQIVQAYLDAKDIDIDVELIYAAIEAAVIENFPKKAALPE